MNTQKYEVDMCNGPIFSKMIRFTLPLIATGVLQLLFNAVDLVVVGKFNGSDALAAVGSTSTIINICTTLFIGISLGVNVLAGQCFSTGDRKKMQEVVHTAIALAIIFGILMMIGAILLAKAALLLLNTPETILGQATLYLRVYFVGMPFFMLYNFGAVILRAIGDTKRPLYFLTIAGISNVVLNLILVLIFHLGVLGVAIGTILSQFISSVFVICTLHHSDGIYRLEFSKIRLNPGMALRILQIGLPAGIQTMLINVSNALIQASINSFGTTMIAANTACGSLFGFMYMGINSITQTGLSFTSQNAGAGKYKRVDKVFMISAVLAAIVGSGIGIFVYVFGRPLLNIFTSDEQVISYGIEIIAISCIPYGFCGLMDMIPGIVRGLGYSLVPMIISVTGVVGFRFIWIYGYFLSHHTLTALYISYPVSWVITSGAHLICFFIIRKIIIPRTAEVYKQT